MKNSTQKFWIDLLQRVFGIDNISNYIEFEKPVDVELLAAKKTTKSSTQRYIDAYIPSCKVLIEQKSSDVDLDTLQKQSGGDELTPYEQAKRYNDALVVGEKADYIIISNFSLFRIYYLRESTLSDSYSEIKLSELSKKYNQFSFFVGNENVKYRREMEISFKAGDIVGKLYDEFLKQYTAPTDDDLRNINMLCVRLVFCLYAEDAGVFPKRDQFYDYLKDTDIKHFRRDLKALFEVLDTKPEDRDKFLEPTLAGFPYVNGGLFKGNVEIPSFTEELKELLLEKASADIDWSDISPTIFGAVFESTLNPETRRSGGMHYTSIENIHKVIDPLFLDNLKAEFKVIKSMPDGTKRKTALNKFQNKLASLKFLDPACGSGNFLTETYISLRRLENEVLRELVYQITLGDNTSGPVKVSIQQFFGIEINDFAVTVAKTALWIAESQMLKETMDIVHSDLDFLPLKTNAYIMEGNALRIDWGSVIPASDLNYIMGNPPFIGYSDQDKTQKDDLTTVLVDKGGKLIKNAGKVDYVSGWYYKTTQLMLNNRYLKAALVSTNSITQGEQVASIWKPLFEDYGIHFDFAYRTFQWDSEANIKAHVHCIIIGFSLGKCQKPRKLFNLGHEAQECDNINAYLMNSDDILVEGRKKPICNVPSMVKGFQPTDNGLLIFSDEDKKAFITKEPSSEKWFKSYISSKKHILGINQWCLWLVNITPKEINEMPQVRDRIKALKEWRELQPKTGDAYKLKDSLGLMRGANSLNITNKYISLPQTSSGNRKYIPIEFIEDAIPNNSMRVVPNADLFQFGMLTSSTHMAWMRVTTGRMKSDYQYTIDTVYNCFPWCNPTTEQKAKIEQTAQSILDARTKYPDCSLFDLYDDFTMPLELRKAHQDNDRAVMAAYGLPKETTEEDCVAFLFKKYQALITETK